jgi:phosphatidylinositol-3-phosphatase
MPTSVQPLEPRLLLSAAPSHKAATVPQYDHIVVVMEENSSYGQILGPSISPPIAFDLSQWPTLLSNPMLPAQDTYIRSLARTSAVFTNAHAITHPSQPNYIALFSGSAQGVTSDATITTRFSAPSLGGQLIAAGKTFTGYSEDLPKAGYTGDDKGSYARRHNPWVNFTDVPASSNLGFVRFPKNFSQLPSLSFVVPNVNHDMHSGSIQEGDLWLQSHLSAYAKWAHSHNSLLVLAWDEDSGTASNNIPLIFSGAHIRPGHYNEPVNDYRLLNTIETSFGVSSLGSAAAESPISDIFM